jgi:hypothetical protein
MNYNTNRNNNNNRKSNFNRSNRPNTYNNTNNNRNSRPKNEQLVAECREMCPNDEFHMRIENNLVHSLEKRIIKYILKR